MLLIGVADDGTLPGLTPADVRRLNQLIGNAATQHMRSPISPTTENVAVGRGRVVIVVTVAGLIVGIPALRLRGDYLAIATLGFGEIINIVIVNTEQIGPLPIGGSSGLHGVPICTNFFWAYGAAAACVVCVWRLAHSAKGKAFLAVREDEIAAAAMGIDTTYHKVAAFAVGAAWAGVAGGLSAMSGGRTRIPRLNDSSNPPDAEPMFSLR